jgi:tetratricopeptide (TPR) repeat protein
MTGINIALIGLLGAFVPLLVWWLNWKVGDGSSGKSRVTYWVGRPNSIGRRFFGREGDLKVITKALKGGADVVLSGGPGTGKSGLAAEFVQKSKRTGFWTQGGETPEQTLLSLAHHLGFERGARNDDEILFQIRRRLRALPAKILWVIDNLSDLDQLNQLLNETEKISLLVTTQDGRQNVIPWGVGFQTVGVLDPESAVRLLCMGGHNDPNEPIWSEIVETVGRLPSAVEALAAQLRITSETPESLLKQLRETSNPLELQRFQIQTAGLEFLRTDSVYNALRGPIDALPRGIQDALAPLGYTADSPIPLALAEALTGLSAGEMINFIDECTGKSVLSATGEQVTIHSLTAAAITATNTDEILRTALRRATGQLGSIIETNHPIPTVEIGHYEHMLSQARTFLGQEDESLIGFSNNLAVGYDNAGRYDDAIKLHTENLGIRIRVLGAEHHDTLTSRNNLANAYRGNGHYNEAARLHEQNLKILETNLGFEHPDTLATRSNLANAYDGAGRHKEAAQLHENILKLRESTLGLDHPDTLGTRSNLANAYYGAGHYKAAINLDAETLRVQIRVLGPEHPDTLATRTNLATGYDNVGRSEEASGLHQEILAVMERVLGLDHPNTLNSRNNLAMAYHSIERYDEAARLHKKTWRLWNGSWRRSTPTPSGAATTWPTPTAVPGGTKMSFRFFRQIFLSNNVYWD